MGGHKARAEYRTGRTDLINNFTPLFSNKKSIKY
jgi:hypothetical protein